MHDSFRSTVQRLHAVLRGEIAAESARDLGVNADALAFYQQLVADQINAVLTKVFPLTQSMMSQNAWRLLTQEYFTQHPPRHYELNACASLFPEFIKSKNCHPAVVELATFEWLEFAVYVDSAQGPGPLNPTLRILSCNYALSRLVATLRSGDLVDFETLTPTAEIVFVYRHPQTLVQQHCRADDGDLFVFKMLHDGMSANQAAALTGINEDVITGLMERAELAGWVLAL